MLNCERWGGSRFVAIISTAHELRECLACWEAYPAVNTAFVCDGCIYYFLLGVFLVCWGNSRLYAFKLRVYLASWELSRRFSVMF